ncbi:unnamed protein product [Calypogeia fissa]
MVSPQAVAVLLAPRVNSALVSAKAAAPSIASSCVQVCGYWSDIRQVAGKGITAHSVDSQLELGELVHIQRVSPAV